MHWFWQMASHHLQLPGEGTYDGQGPRLVKKEVVFFMSET